MSIFFCCFIQTYREKRKKHFRRSNLGKFFAFNIKIQLHCTNVTQNATTNLSSVSSQAYVCFVFFFFFNDININIALCCTWICLELKLNPTFELFLCFEQQNLWLLLKHSLFVVVWQNKSHDDAMQFNSIQTPVDKIKVFESLCEAFNNFFRLQISSLQLSFICFGFNFAKFCC